MPFKKENLNRSLIRLLSSLLISFFLSIGYSQNGVAINTTGTTANASAMLDVSSTTGGILIPRMTSAQRLAISISASTNGLLVYQTDGTAGFYYYNGSAWTLLASAGNINSITLGQSASTVYGNAALTLSNSNTSFNLIPNLSTVITVPSNAYVYIATDGSAATNNISGSSGFSAIDIAVVIDGSVVSNGGYQPLAITNSEGLVGVSKNWGISLYQSLSAGTHTISVYAASEGISGGSSSTISGNSSSAYQGELTVIIIKQ